MEHGRPGAAALGPTGPEYAGDAVEITETAMLHCHERGGGGGGYHQSDKHRQRDLRVGLQPDE